MDPKQNPNHPEQRFLVPGAPTGRFELGYSTEAKLAMREEPECLDEDDWRRYVKEDAKQRERAQQRGLELEVLALSQQERFEKATLEARRLRRDVSQWSRVYIRLVAKGKPRQADKWLQRMEQIAYLGRVA